MPKWDKTRNYYADLELTSIASTEEIKKQFRKLALKYHPDRNPGREIEFQSKFQIIQSAHEILTDETLRKQYDDARRTRHPAASGVRGNPWQEAGKNYPPPPRRQNNQTRQASGAQRYESFAGNFTGGAERNKRPQTPKDDPQFRRSNADAWEQMRPNSTRRNPQAPPPPPPPTPGRAPTSAARDSRPGPTPVPPRTAYQKQKAQAAFGTSKKTGFTPSAPGVADEPPVTNKNYFTTRTHSYFAPDPATPRTEARPASGSYAGTAAADPLGQFKEKFMDERQSSPYHSPGGEKTSLFDRASGLGRSASERVPRSTGMPGAFPHHRQQGSSPARSSSNDGDSEDSTKTNLGHSADGAPDRNSTTQPSRAGERYKPKTAETPANNPPPSAFPMPTASAAHTGNTSPSGFHFAPESNKAAASAGARSFTRNSTDNINTRFVDDELVNEWQFTAGSASANEATEQQRKPRAQPRNRPVRRPTPLTNPFTTPHMPPPQEAADSTNSDGPASFSAGKWSEQIGPQHFEPQPMSSSSTSPSRRPHLAKSRSFRTATGKTTVTDEEERPEPRQEPPLPPRPRATSIAEEDAMDIDSPPPPRAESIPKPAKVNSARTYSAEPYRAEWRAGDMNGGAPLQTTGLGPSTNGAKDAPRANGTKPAVTTAFPLPNGNGGSEDSEEFRTTFADFKNVEPFAEPRVTGFKSWEDLKSTLPFQSQPSEQAPREILNPPRPVKVLKFPTVPVAPRVPPIAVGIRPSNASFRKYAQDFNSYMQKWEAFEDEIIDHITTRQSAYKARRLGRGANWLEGGVANYLTELDQDLDVQIKYANACTEHRKRVAEYMRFRDQIN